MKFKKSDIYVLIFLFIILGTVYLYHNQITKFIYDKVVIEKESFDYSPNIYTRGNRYVYFDQTNNFFPSSKKELKNIIYTLLDSGNNVFSFVCGDNYTTCEKDLREISNDGTLNHINNFIHPFNSFKSINLSINSFGKITVNVSKNYTEHEISTVNNLIDNFIESNVREDMSLYDKILLFHDYIVNNTRYDSKEALIVEQNSKASDLTSHKAYNVLVNGIGLCGGYTDAMAIYLSKLGVNNFKVANEKHIWNVVNYEGKWLHLDATWDDPITASGKDLIIHDYFLISNDKLQQLDSEKHKFDYSIYSEAR